MSTEVVSRTPMWRNLVWFGVAGSVVAWALAWFVSPTKAPALVMLIVAFAAVGLVYRAGKGTRIAWAGLIVAGVVLLLGAVLYTGLLLITGGLPAGHATIVDWLFTAVFPMATAVSLIVGAALTFRFAREG